MEKVKVIIERGHDGLYSYYMDNDDFDFGLNGQGQTVEAAEAEFMEAYKEIREMYAEEGKIFPEIEFDFQYDVPSFLNYYSGILSKSGLEKVTGINQKQLWHYANGHRNPSRETIRKIQDGLHRLARELSHVNFL